MPPKKAQKMSLNEFLGDNALGSWADEMDSLPTAPAARSDDDRSYPGDRRRDDFLSSRPDRGPMSHREDLPLPTEPPYTVFVGNLAFDLTDIDLEEFFAGHQTKSVKIIKDREEKPKGFGYVEFAELEGLKDALAKSGSSLAGRNVRISVAEPPKERSGFGGGGFDDDKFSSNWRRDGPPPDLSSRDAPRRRFEGAPGAREPPPPSLSDNASDWRSSKPRSAQPPEPEGPSFKRRGSGFRSQDGAPAGSADAEETWTIGSRFKPSAPSEPSSRFGSVRGRGEMGPPRDPSGPAEEGDWRRSSASRQSTSPNSSMPPTPQMTRRKLELLPRTGSSATPSPLSSPNPANAKPNPFGSARPVDTVAKEIAVAERLEKEREQVRDRVAHHPMSRTSSRTASQRGEPRGPASPSSPKAAESPKLASAVANVRPSFSFANAAAGKKDATSEDTDDKTDELTEKVADLEVS